MILDFVILLFLAVVSCVIFVLLKCSHYFMTLDLKKMLEIKQISVFLFLVLEIFVKTFPFSGKEQIRNYRKNMSNDKLREVCDKFRKRKERQQKKLMTIKELNKKKRKDRERQQQCRQKSKLNKEQDLEESLINKKKKVDKFRKQSSRQEKWLIKINMWNTFSKRQKNHLPSITDSSLSIQTPNMSTIYFPVDTPTPASPETSLSKIIWYTLTPHTKKKNNNLIVARLNSWIEFKV